jgi:hypothetical protein
MSMDLFFVCCGQHNNVAIQGFLMLGLKPFVSPSCQWKLSQAHNTQVKP